MIMLHQMYLHKAWCLAKDIEKACAKVFLVGSAFIKLSPGADIWGNKILLVKKSM